MCHNKKESPKNGYVSDDVPKNILPMNGEEIKYHTDKGSSRRLTMKKVNVL
jgi:hypothetical protein